MWLSSSDLTQVNTDHWLFTLYSDNAINDYPTEHSITEVRKRWINLLTKDIWLVRQSDRKTVRQTE